MSKRDRNKEAYWRLQFSQQKSSGTSAVSFCKRRRISVHQFYWWRRKLSSLDAQEGDGQKDEEASFIPVRLPAFTQGTIEVVHPGGCVIRVPAGFDTDSLRRVLDTLSAPPSEEQ